MRTLLLLDAPSLFARVARFTSFFSSLVLGLAFPIPLDGCFRGRGRQAQWLCRVALRRVPHRRGTAGQSREEHALHW